MRETLVVQGVLALIGVAFVIAGGAFLSTSVPLGLLGAVGGLLVIGGAIVVVLRKQRTMSAHPHK
ncbi:hypothetical protein QMG61_04640 [Cryobacterium sp. PH31-AA6]|uniref:hypothetical protein n=1 Tax=Cryobacterium sp. PH31-AA6 TaxID=3046205 RepID=UPI0024BA8C78|nr:hypothetical protein [Cryobacterium sp. PH31-AA6]MDJ0323051.1 hypothetical protein [Cryobacterium sp. PH31-AA6]